MQKLRTNFPLTPEGAIPDSWPFGPNVIVVARRNGRELSPPVQLQTERFKKVKDLDVRIDADAG